MAELWGRGGAHGRKTESNAGKGGGGGKVAGLRRLEQRFVVKRVYRQPVQLRVEPIFGGEHSECVQGAER